VVRADRRRGLWTAIRPSGCTPQKQREKARLDLYPQPVGAGTAVDCLQLARNPGRHARPRLVLYYCSGRRFQLHFLGLAEIEGNQRCQPGFFLVSAALGRGAVVGRQPRRTRFSAKWQCAGSHRRIPVLFVPAFGYPPACVGHAFRVGGRWAGAQRHPGRLGRKDPNLALGAAVESARNAAGGAQPGRDSFPEYLGLSILSGVDCGCAGLSALVGVRLERKTHHRVFIALFWHGRPGNRGVSALLPQFLLPGGRNFAQPGVLYAGKTFLDHVWSAAGPNPVGSWLAAAA